ncbi:angiopoietin-related protein 1-like [Liolophura sinensis]|uniref:angiopoietin-related protein 1-like n=1 Tax=Liolophura sinensis TaxID=3198878 RepID=UPI0031589B33
MKQKTGLKHVKLELAGFIQEFLPEDDDDDLEEYDDDDDDNDDEVYDAVDGTDDKSTSGKMHHDESLQFKSSTKSTDNSAQLTSDTLTTDGSGNAESVMQTRTVQLTISPSSEPPGPRNQNNHSGPNRQNDKKLKKEMKLMKESLTEKDIQMERLQSKVLNLSLDLAKLENNILLLHKDGEIMKTQQEAANFTQYMIALDQWRISSPLIINTTQENQEQLDILGELILNNTNRLGKLEVKLLDHRYLMEHTELTFERELHRINETLKKVRHRTHHHDHAMTEELAQQFEDMHLKLEQLGSRLMNIEVKVLNSSLNTCAKQQADFYQDIKLKEMNKKLDKMQESILVHRETLTRTDRGLYRLHLDIKSHKDAIDTLKRESKKMSSYKPEFKAMQEEVTKFLHHLPQDCNEVYLLGQRESGEYIIHPEGSPKSVRVYCELTDEGGWTVIQRRVDGSEHFSRPWKEYKEGFGTISREFWLGNDYIYLLTNQKNCSLFVEMYDTFGQKWVAEYDVFKMNDEGKKYSLFLDGYHGNATDSLGDANGMAFSTEDRDQDASSTHCALYYTAGWWYKHCHYCNLNGRYNVGIVWFNQEVNEWLQMNKTVMKIISH